MKVVGFNFNKINMEKFKTNFEKLNINTNIDISDIKDLKQELFKTKDEFIGVKFKFTLNYEPEIAKIEFSGDIIFSVESKLAREVIKQWKEKKIPEDFRVVLYNVILRKSSLKAFQLEEETNLPLHLSLPSIRKEDLKEASKKK